jgi:uncharacterized protein YjbJ (UPF0337 family)
MRTSGTTDIVIGAANQAIGKAMQGIGEALGSETLKHKGVVQEAIGDAQITMGKVKAEAGPPVEH